MTQIKNMVIVLTFFTVSFYCSADSPYLGQDPPGMIPEVFAPGIVSLPNRCEVGGVFSPNMDEFYFTETDGRWTWTRIMMTTSEDEIWSSPVYAPFFNYNDSICRFILDDPDTMYFFRYSSSTATDVWKIKRLGSTWGQTERLPEPVNSSAAEWGYTQAEDGTLYVSSRRSGNPDIYRIETENGSYGPAEPVLELNSIVEDNGPFVSRDHSFIMFHSHRAGGFGAADLYVSFRQGDGTWSEAINMGPMINTSIEQWDPKITPDGKYLFYIHRSGWSTDNETSDIYWVDIRAVLPDPNGPIENLTSGQRFGSIQCAINYAEPGDTLVASPGLYQEYINFNGKNIILTSTDPDDEEVVANTIIDADGINRVVTFAGTETSACQLTGFTITGGYSTEYGGGIQGNGAYAGISKCVITGNTTDKVGGAVQNFNGDISECRVIGNTANQGGAFASCRGRISNCIISDNTATTGCGGINNSDNDIVNCTITNNTGGDSGGIRACDGTVTNCIIWGNGEPEILNCTAAVEYSCFVGGIDTNIDTDPLFADPNNGDYHLQSLAGRWDPVGESWVYDAVINPCIDAGDPVPDWHDELWPHGGRINMGAYGGTPQASMSGNTVGNIADFNCDDEVNVIDLEQFAKDWLRNRVLLHTDMDRDNDVDLTDFAVFMENFMR